MHDPQGSIGKDWYMMEMEWSYVGAVVISGLVIVFVALILLIFMVWLMGKVFEAIKGNKQTETESAANVANAANAVSAPVSAAGTGADDDEVIAVISAAVAMMAQESGTALQIKSITPTRKKPARNAWAAAAAAESTRSF